MILTLICVLVYTTRLILQALHIARKFLSPRRCGDLE